MALRTFMNAVLLFAAFAYGHNGYGHLKTSNEDAPGPYDSDKPAPANTNTPNEAFSQGGKCKFVGMNICGFDFGCNSKGSCDFSLIEPPLPNVPPTHTDPGNPLNNGTAQMAHFVAADGFNIFRLPVSWQYLVNNDLGGPLNPTNVSYYDQLVRGCLSTGAYCMIDLHNYARWDGKRIGEDGGPTTSQFADLWGQLAARYRDDDRVWFGVMNEPYDLPSPSPSAWRDAVQAVVTAIRGAGAEAQFISLPGAGYQSPGHLISGSGDGEALEQVVNPDGTTTGLVFDVHLYLDAKGSGTKRGCVTSGIEENWAPLADWLRKRGRQAIVTETGGGDTSSCKKYLCQQLRYLDDNVDVFLGYVIWAAGSFKSSYELSMTPSIKGGSWEDVSLLTQCVARR